MPWLKYFVAGLSPRTSNFDTRPVYVEFVVEMTIGQTFLRILRVSPTSPNLKLFFIQSAITLYEVSN